MKYSLVSMVTAEVEKVCVLCVARTEAEGTVEYRVYNTRWQHACEWYKFWFVLKMNERQRKEAKE